MMHQSDRVPRRTLDRFKRWFWRRPRAHGDTILDRRVSPLESLYDLVYAVVISQAAHPLEQHITAHQTVAFAVVFALIWIAWTNGSLYLELHGREDGRTRAFVFIQMGILALVAVFAANAAGDGGRAFALAYAAFLVVMTWLWYAVQRQDRVERPELEVVTSRYVNALVVSVAVMLVSAVLPVEPRLIAWAALAGGWIVLVLLLLHNEAGQTPRITPTESLVERFGLFTIIVLGEVVFGVVAGLSAAEHGRTTIATGLIALVVGFGFWWIYFDVVGGRLPNRDGRAVANWIVSHCPITLRCDGRRGRGGSDCRLGATGTVAPGGAARGHPVGALGRRRARLPARRCLGRRSVERGLKRGTTHLMPPSPGMVGPSLSLLHPSAEERQRPQTPAVPT